MQRLRDVRGPRPSLSLGFLLLGLFAISSACSKPQAADSRVYTPLFAAAVEAAKAHPAGTVGAAFAEAASAKGLVDAALRWDAFLKRYAPEAETEDAVQKRYIDAARYELIRAYYLLGREQDGDRLMLATDPLRLRQ